MSDGEWEPADHETIVLMAALALEEAVTARRAYEQALARFAMTGEPLPARPPSPDAAQQALCEAVRAWNKWREGKR